MYCLKCEHQLTGVESLNCPECGHPFNPRDARTFARTPRDLIVVRPYRRTLREFLLFGGITVGTTLILMVGLILIDALDVI